MKKRVKAWALMIEGDLIGDGHWAYDIYPTKEDALGVRKANHAEEEWDVVPCWIEFKMPKAKLRGKKTNGI